MDNASSYPQQPVHLHTLNHESQTSVRTSSPNDCESTIEPEQQSHENNARVSMSEQKSMGVTVETELLAKLQSGKFQNERLGPFKIAGDVLAILLPIGLLAFMIRIWRLDRNEMDPSIFAKWANSINVFATLFPILFASIIGRCVYELSRWKLERGSTMGMLEQLLGSRSVGAAVVTQFQLRALNALGISLLVLWAFSPLGSQSILRALTSSLESREATSTIAIYDNLHASGLNIRNRWSEGSSSDSGEPANKFNGYLRVLFNAMLMTPKSIKVGPMDQWGNVKIPFLPFVDGNSTEDKDEWQERASGAGIFEDYSSVAGLPVANIAFGNTTFSIESSYVELNCQNVSTATNMTGSVPDMHVQWNGSATAEFANGTWWGITSGVYNSTTSDSYRSWSIALDNFVDGYWYDMENRSRSPRFGADASPLSFVEEKDIQVNPTKLFFRASLSFGLLDDYPNILSAFCDVRQRYVESRVVCERVDATDPSRNCTVTAQRPSQKPRPTEMISHLNFKNVFTWLTTELPQVARGGASLGADMVVQYLNDPKLNNIANISTDEMFKDIDPVAFSRRLSQVLNTYLLLSQTYLSAPGGSTEGSPLNHNSTVDVQNTTLVHVYAVSRLWISLGMLSCLVLLAGGIMSVVSRLMAAGPEILGYASAVVRDSKHVTFPPGTDKMNGLEITKIMKNQRVRYGFTDVSRDGHLVAAVGLENETTSITGPASKYEPLL